MTISVANAIGYAWEGLGLVWLAGLAFRKRTVRTQPDGAWLFHLALAFLGFSLLGSQWFRDGWMGMRFVPAVPALQVAGLALTIAGCLFAVWARIKLGSNWSGRATVKVGHRLVTTGPYALARHPIYTGIIVAVVGTALAGGEWRCLLAVVVLLLALAIKMSQEERLMMQTFPEKYPQYRQRVKALIPGLL